MYGTGQKVFGLDLRFLASVLETIGLFEFYFRGFGLATLGLVLVFFVGGGGPHIIFRGFVSNIWLRVWPSLLFVLSGCQQFL